MWQPFYSKGLSKKSSVFFSAPEHLKTENAKKPETNTDIGSPTCDIKKPPAWLFASELQLRARNLTRPICWKIVGKVFLFRIHTVQKLLGMSLICTLLDTQNLFLENCRLAFFFKFTIVTFQLVEDYDKNHYRCFMFCRNPYHCKVTRIAYVFDTFRHSNSSSLTLLVSILQRIFQRTAFVMEEALSKTHKF